MGSALIIEACYNKENKPLCVFSTESQQARDICHALPSDSYGKESLLTSDIVMSIIDYCQEEIESIHKSIQNINELLIFWRDTHLTTNISDINNTISDLLSNKHEYEDREKEYDHLIVKLTLINEMIIDSVNKNYTFTYYYE